MKAKTFKNSGIAKWFRQYLRKRAAKKIKGYKKFPVLRIEAGDNAPAIPGIRFFLDGVDITSGIRNLELHIGLDEAIHAHFEIIVRPDIPDILLQKIYMDKIEDSLNIIKEKAPVNQVGGVEKT